MRPQDAAAQRSEWMPHEAQIARAVRVQRAVRRTVDAYLDAGLGPDEFSVDVLPGGKVAVTVAPQTPLAPGVSTLRDLILADPIAWDEIYEGTRPGDAQASRCLDAFWARGGQVTFRDRSRVPCDVVIHVQATGGIARVLDVLTRPEWCAADYDQGMETCMARAYRDLVFPASHDYEFRVAQGVCTIAP